MSTTTQQPPATPIEEEASGMPQWVKIIVAIVFYSGLTIFLLGSIGHVAWFFHLYEPQGDGWAMVPSYGKAGSLDLAIFFLAYVAATGKATDKWIVWIFTVILTCISLYANYVYAMFFSPERQTHIWNIQILWGVTTTGWLSPLIASSYPLFAIVFMYLIERVISRKAETPAQMQARLNALRIKKELERQIKEVEGPGFIQRAKNGALEVKSAAAEVLKKEQKQPEVLPQNAPISAPTLPEKSAQNAPVLSAKPMEDKLQITLDFLQKNPAGSDEELAEVLHLNRPASARFWRLKADEIISENGSMFTPKSSAKITAELDQDPPITDPEIEAVGMKELPEDEEEQNASDGSSQAGQEGAPEMKNSVNIPAQDSPKRELKGMLYRQAAKLPICQEKSISAAEIRAAVRSKNLRTYSDGSVSKSAIETWAKSYQKLDQKQEAVAV
jgi:hypothetical protein